MGQPRLFLVRVWQHLSEFRASVRGIDQEEPRLFDEPSRLGEFLHAASADAGEGADEHIARDALPVGKEGA